jgi:hypothetical protein
MKTIPQKRHCFSWFAFIKVALGLCAPVRFVTLRIAHNVVITVKNKEHDHSPSKPDKTTNPVPLTATVQSEKTNGPIPSAKPNAPMAKTTANNAQKMPIKILYSMTIPELKYDQKNNVKPETNPAKNAQKI